MEQKKNGFTFIEILVATVIIAVMTSIIVVTYSSASRTSRDARRKKDLANIQAALEIYKVQHGEYPSSAECVSGGGWTWPTCVAPRWIPDLDEDYIPSVPVDPKQNAAEFIGNSTPPTLTHTYNYQRVTPASYYLLTRLENENDVGINGDDYGFTGEGIYVLVEPK